MKQPRLNKKKAFTFVELLIVMAIIGILTVTVVVGVNWSTDRARESGVQSTLHSYEIAANKVGVQLAGYDNSSLDELVKLLNKSLDSELKLSISDGVIVSDAVDPWGNTIKVGFNKPNETNGQLKFASAGPNGQLGDSDDIVVVLTHTNQNGKGDVVVEHPESDHDHDYSAHVESSQYLVTPGTCTTPAKYYVSCSCGDVGYGTFTGSIDSSNHTSVTTSYIELNTTHHTKKEVCSDCNIEFTSQDELHVGELECTLCGAIIHTHTYDQQVATSTYQYLPASCISKAKYYYSCSCGAKGTETFESGNFAEHMYTAMNTGVAGAKVSDATCVSKAVYYKSCVGCGALGTETFETGEVNLTNHVGNSRTEYTNLNGSQHLKKITCDACNTMKSSTNENHTMNAQNTCTLCNAHVHTYNQQVASSTYLKSSATCTSKAVYYKSCSCGEKGTETFESGTTTSHNMTNTVGSEYLKSAANCITKAIYYRSCSYCGTKDTATFENGNVDMMNHVGNASTTYESLNATQHTKKVTCDSCHTTKSTTTENHTMNAQNTCTLCSSHVHNFSRKDTSATYLYRAADCTNPAIYYYSCACGLKGTETFNHGSTAAHNYVAETATDTYLKSVATCTAKAVYYKSCSGCGAKGTATFEVGTVNASNHSKTTKVKATTASVCWKWECCGAAYDTTHVMANTGTAGVHQTCSDCGYYTTAHTYNVDSGVQYSAATCTAARKNYQKCSCGYNPQNASYVVSTGSVNASNHTGSSTYGGTSGVHTKYTCCGATISGSHTYDQNSGVKYSDATCTVKQKNYKSCVCGYNPRNASHLVEVGSVNASNHTGTSTYGGTASVHTKYTCCGATISGSHTYDQNSGVKYSDATCGMAQQNYKSCVCGYNPKSTSYLVSVGTTNGSAHTGTSTYGGTSGVHTKYTCCGATISASHTYDQNSGVKYSDATCTAKQKNYKSCICGYNPRSTSYLVEVGSVNASNHTGSSVNGGTAGVHTKYSCCGATISTTHTYNVDSGVQYSAATCTAARKNYQKCSCGYNPQSASYVVSTGSVNASNHTGSSVNGGTASVHTKYSCCGATISTTHNYNVDSGVQYTAATCLAARKNYLKCSCGYNPQSSSYVVSTGSVNASNHAGTSTYGGTASVHTKYTCCGVTISGSHTYDQDSGVQYSAATCVAARKNYKKCACGYNPQSASYVVSTGSVNSSNHTGGTYYSYTNLNATQHTKYTKCNSCNTSLSSTNENHTLNAQNTCTLCNNHTHSYTQQVVSSTYLNSNATCTSKATYFYSCVCGAKGTTVFENGSVLGHSWTNACDTTCNRDSSHTRTITHTYSYTCDTTCNVCGYTRSASHNMQQTKAATCTAAGTKTCSYGCGTTQSITALGHSWAYTCSTSCARGCGTTRSASHNYQQTKAATCTATGTKTCSYGCGSTQSITALGHSWTYTCSTSCARGCGTTRSASHNSVNAATASVCKKCSYCGTSLDTTHTYSYTCDTTCNDCGYTRSASHNYTYTCSTSCSYGCGTTRSASHNYQQTKAATCTATGTKTCSYGCGSTQTIAALGHTGGTANCTTKAVCTRCNTSYGSVDSTKHSYGSATCTSAATCTRCGLTSGSAIGHLWAYTCSTTCGRSGCGTTRSASHNYQQTKAATCTATGTKTCSYGCGSTQTIAKHSCTWSYACDTTCNCCGCTRSASHKSVNAATASVCKKCEYCGTSLDTSHTYSYTCDTTCNDCGYTRSASHNYQRTKDPTCTATGTNTCSYGCGSTQTVAKHSCTWSYACDTTCNCCGCTRSASHNYQQTKAATCTATGTKTCSYGCGSTQTIAKHSCTWSYACDTTCNCCGCTRSASHNYQTTKAATCTATGTKTCSYGCGSTQTIAKHSCTWSYDCDTTCNCCGCTRSASHNYTRTKDPTCTTTGTNTCSYGCGTTQTVAKHSCTWSYACDTTCNCCGCTRSASHNSVNATTASVCKKCSYCGTSLDTSHAYSYTCDTTCNDCGYTRSASHNYTYTCSTSCSYGCGTTRTASHNSVNAATSSVCKKCSYCGTSLDTSHAYSYTCDTTCNDCGYTRSTSHSYTYTCSTSCRYGCGTTRTAYHYVSSPDIAWTYGSAACTAIAVGNCDYCGTSRSKALNVSSHLNETPASCLTQQTWDCATSSVSATTEWAAIASEICSTWHYGAPATGHYADYSDDIEFSSNCTQATAYGMCNNCGADFSETVTTTRNANRAATCTKGEWYDYSASFTRFGDECSCPDYHYTGSSTGLGHSYTSTYKVGSNATYCTRKCSRCSTYGTSTTQHSWSTTTSATCTAAGSAKCSNCSQTKTIAQKSHSYTAKSTTSTYLKSSATCTSAAVYYYKCSTCTAKGTSTYTSGSAKGHTAPSGQYPDCDRAIYCTVSGCGAVVHAKKTCGSPTYQVHLTSSGFLGIGKKCYEYEVCAHSYNNDTDTCRRYHGYNGKISKSSCSLGSDRHLSESQIRDLPSDVDKP